MGGEDERDHPEDGEGAPPEPPGDPVLTGQRPDRDHGSRVEDDRPDHDEQQDGTHDHPGGLLASAREHRRGAEGHAGHRRHFDGEPQHRQDGQPPRHQQGGHGPDHGQDGEARDHDGLATSSQALRHGRGQRGGRIVEQVGRTARQRRRRHPHRVPAELLGGPQRGQDADARCARPRWQQWRPGHRPEADHGKVRIREPSAPIARTAPAASRRRRSTASRSRAATAASPDRQSV